MMNDKWYCSLHEINHVHNFSSPLFSSASQDYPAVRSPVTTGSSLRRTTMMATITITK